VDIKSKIERMCRAARTDEKGNAFKWLHKIQLIIKLNVLISIAFLKIITLSSMYRLNSKGSIDLKKLTSAANDVASAAVRTQDFAIALKRNEERILTPRNITFLLHYSTGSLGSKVLKVEHIMDSVVK
jgi:hypothetical protein